MQSPCAVACESRTSALHQQFLGFQFHNALPPPFPLLTAKRRSLSVVACNFSGGRGPKSKKLVSQQKPRDGLLKGKENVWSVDNEMAKAEKEAGRGKRKGKRGGKRVKTVRKRSSDGRVVVSGSMLVEIETVLQTQEPVVKPSWTTFVSSISGIWKGVGAVFSPITAEMEPVDVGSKSEYLYDCYTYSRIAPVTGTYGGSRPHIQRIINWVTLNPFGELQQKNGKKNMGAGELKDGDESAVANNVMPIYESYDFAKSDVMEEDTMGMEPGLVYFEDGSYSRGPVEIPVGEVQSDVPLTFKFEQCLVKGCHRRLRIIHTIDFNNGGADIQIMRVAVYEEEWTSPANMDDQSDGEFDLKLFSQRKRTQPSQLTGPWKVFEVSATPIFGEEASLEESNGSEIPYVYLCTETMKKRSLPENPVYFGEEEILDLQDAAILWLPGGVTAYVDVDKEGTLCIGVGWYSEEGINLVMERDYGTDGKLKEVRSKSEVTGKFLRSA
uniref:Uncharacterized protein n=1 Tax=Kalanchoe fedtschenkoi TaxID=63787 RepID=A0A7N0UPK5_KALFE